jgi:hypothetical protein
MLTKNSCGPDDFVRWTRRVNLPAKHLGAAIALEVVVELHAPVWIKIACYLLRNQPQD